MSTWVIWVIAAAVFLVAEMFTLALYMAPCALGALAALGAGFLGVPFYGQVIVFALVSLMLVFAMRPLAKKHAAKPILTGPAALVGQQGKTLSPVDSEDGRVRVSSGEWSAKSAQPIPPDTKVQVDRIDGVTLWISPLKDDAR